MQVQCKYVLKYVAVIFLSFNLIQVEVCNVEIYNIFYGHSIIFHDSFNMYLYVELIGKIFYFIF
jgi:hypothetical protein